MIKSTAAIISGVMLAVSCLSAGADTGLAATGGNQPASHSWCTRMDTLSDQDARQASISKARTSLSMMKGVDVGDLQVVKEDKVAVNNVIFMCIWVAPSAN